MSLLNWMLGRSEQSFSRPFHKNETEADFREWFSKAPSWNALDPRITDALIDRLYRNPMFEVFVHLSWEADLVKQYAPLYKSLESGIVEAFYGQINQILYRIGCSNLDRVIDLMRLPQRTEDVLKKPYGLAMDSFESSIQLQPSFLPAYVQLAILKHILGRDDEAREFCNRGLVQVEELKKAPLPSGPDMNLRGAVEETEMKLRTLLKDL